MKKKFLIISLIIICQLFNKSTASAVDNCPESRAKILKFSDADNNSFGDGFSPDVESADYVIKVTDTSSKYKLYVDGNLIDEKYADSFSYIRGTIDKKTYPFVFWSQRHTFSLERDDPDPAFRKYCEVNYEVLAAVLPTPIQQSSCVIADIISDKEVKDSKEIYFTPSTTITSKINIDISNLSSPIINNITLEIIEDKSGKIVKKISQNRENLGYGYYREIVSLKPGQTSADLDISLGKLDPGDYKIRAEINGVETINTSYAKQTKTFQTSCIRTDKISIGNEGGSLISPTPTPTITPIPTISSICTTGIESYKAQERGECGLKYAGCPWCLSPTPKIRAKPPTPTPPPLIALCDQLTKNNDYRKQCTDCVGTDKPTGKLWTAIGCVPIDYSGFVSEIVMKTGAGIAGGVAFLYFLYGAFMILTSTGNAEKLEEAKQIITSALAGLILIIFSVFLLRAIGVDILQLPGFH